MSKTKIYTPYDEWVIKKLRQLSMDWPAKEACLNGARVGPGQYLCASCMKTFKDRYSLKADHIEPVIDPHVGFVGIASYVERLFVHEDKLQALCAPCHQTKTNAENAIRKAASKARLAAQKE